MGKIECALSAARSRTVGRCHLKTEAILWPSLPYYTGNNTSAIISTKKLLRFFSITSRLCMNHCITCLHSHGCDEKVARWGENVSSMFTFRNFVMALYHHRFSFTRFFYQTCNLIIKGYIYCIKAVLLWFILFICMLTLPSDSCLEVLKYNGIVNSILIFYIYFTHPFAFL